MPIVLSCSNEDAEKIRGGQTSVCLYFEDKPLAVMTNVTVYGHRKEERCARQFGLNHTGHPYQKYIWEECGDWLVGGDLTAFERIKWNDGLDDYRLTPVELRQRYKEINVSCLLINIISVLWDSCYERFCLSRFRPMPCLPSSLETQFTMDMRS